MISNTAVLDRPLTVLGEGNWAKVVNEYESFGDVLELCKLMLDASKPTVFTTSLKETVI